MTPKEIFKKYNAPQNFINREMSWLEFNRRVLEEALNPELPLLERVKFVSIFSSNLDEFYMIRISGLMELIAAGFSEPTIDGLTPIEQMKKMKEVIQPMLDQLMNLWKEQLVPALRDNGIHLLEYAELTDEESALLNEYFKKEIFPVLTPLAYDPGRPFPYISNLSLSFAIHIRNPKGEDHFARVKVPNSLPQLLRVDTLMQKTKTPRSNGTIKFIWLGDLIKQNLAMLFPRMEIIQAYRFRITRDTDIEIQEDEADDLLKEIEENIRQRRFGNVVRLEVDSSTPEFMINTLVENLEIGHDEVQMIDGPLGLADVLQLYNLPLHQLKEKPYVPVIPKIFETEEDIFSVLKERDIILHHPYDSFMPVIDFIKQASKDPDVLAIKQTLYRVGSNSPVVKYLIEAAQRGKQVAVLVELKARFDEENNIFWARELEKVGAHVVYGLVGLKTHAKMTLVVRKELEGVRRYVHLGTGNYNATTAKLYTDLGMFTTNPEMCEDVSNVFNYLTGYSKQTDFNKIIVAPVNFREKMYELIQYEITAAQEGKPAQIILKLNSLVDPTIIAMLYEASNAGVQTALIIRGICCLVPGVPGMSENISVTSVVGRYLEHSRILYFRHGGEELVYFSSADFMQRNLDRRVEFAFPILDKNLRDQVIGILLRVHRTDNVKARMLNTDHSYSPVIRPEGEKKLNSQEWFSKHCPKIFKKRSKKIVK